MGAIYPILCNASGGFGKYSTGGVPTSYLITPDGKVAWHGHPSGLKDGMIEAKLKDVDKEFRVSTWAFIVKKSLPPIPPKLAAIEKSLAKMKFGAALKKVESTLSHLEGEEQEAGEQIRAWIEGAGTREMERAEALIGEDEVYKAFLLYTRVGERFKGHEIGTQAKKAIKALKSDKGHALEIKASEKLASIKKAMASERKPKDQLKCLKPLLGKKYRETAAGKVAAKLAEELEKKIG